MENEQHELESLLAWAQGVQANVLESAKTNERAFGRALQIGVAEIYGDVVGEITRRITARTSVATEALPEPPEPPASFKDFLGDEKAITSLGILLTNDPTFIWQMVQRLGLMKGAQ